jgi:SNF2 family DNA or RNA helicase
MDTCVDCIKNTPEFGEIPSSEHVIAVNHSPLEALLYKELHLHLKSNQFEIQILSRRSSNFREDQNERINQVLRHSDTAHEALLKRAVYFEEVPPKDATSRSVSCIQDLLQVRETGFKECLSQFTERIEQAVRLVGNREAQETDFFSFVDDLRKSSLFTDRGIAENLESAIALRPTLSSRRLSTATPRGHIADEPLIAGDERAGRKTAKMIGKRKAKGSLKRPSKKMKVFQDQEDESKDQEDIVNNSESENDAATSRTRGPLRKQMSTLQSNLTSLARQFGTLQQMKTICTKATASLDIGESHEYSYAKYGGSKLAELVKLLKDKKRIPGEDRVILFVQYEQILQAAQKALKKAKIGHVTITARELGTQGKIDKFTSPLNIQRAIDNDSNKVLILVMGGENAAGL